jgi:multidrug efflux pump subunit AcrB
MLQFIFEKRTGFILLVILLCILGGMLTTQLPVQLYPRTNRPRVRTSINHPGYSAVDFSREYSSTIESQLLAVEGVDILEVQYGSDRSTFSMTFDWDVDSEKAKADVESAMNTVKNQLPAAFRDDYRVRFYSGENAGYLMLGIRSQSMSPEKLYSILTTTVEPSLKQVQDVEVVEIFNVEDLRLDITLRQVDMLSYGLTISDVDAAMRQGTVPESIGSLNEGEKRYSVRFSRGGGSLYQVGELPIAQRGNVKIRLQDIADIDIQYTIPRQTFIMDGKRGILITASPIDGGNIKMMSEEMVGVLEEARGEGILPADTQINLFLDPASYIDRSINSVVRAALLGAALAMLVVLFTLGEIKNTVLIGISLPVTLILSFILMYAFDLSLNLISLGGMALAVGMVIDSSIVVMENIHRFRITEGEDYNNGQLKDVIVRAVRQVRSPVIASILTSILVFLPIPFTSPLTNAILGDQAKVVIFALAFSMLVALTVMPMMAFFVYRKRGTPTSPSHDVSSSQPGSGPPAVLHGIQKISVPAMNRLIHFYKRVLRGLLMRKWAAGMLLFAVSGLLLFSIFVLLPLIPKEIISSPSSDRIVVFLRRATPIETEVVIDEVLPEMDRKVKDAVGDYISGTYAEVRGHFNRFFIILEDSRDADYVMGELQKIFVSDNTWYYHVLKWDPAELPLPRTLDLQISVHGDDEAEKVAILERTRDMINEMEIYGWVFTQPSTGYSDELIMTPRPETINGLSGYNESNLLSLIRRILSGTQSIEFEEDEMIVEASAEYPDTDIEGRKQLENFLLPYAEGTVPLKHFFDFHEATSVAEIASENGEPIFRVYAAMRPGSPAADREKNEVLVRQELDEKLSLPPGYSLTFDNPQAEMDNAIRSLFIALAASVALIYLLLSFQFNSMKTPLVILVTIPLGFIGLVFSLLIFRSTLSLNSLLGAILLSGIVVNNAILMIDFYLNYLPGYDNTIDALVDTAGIRFTPIIITTLTTILGMLPIAIGMGEGSNIIQPLGIAVSGGLFVSTLLMLFVVPSILRFFRIRAEGE